MVKDTVFLSQNLERSQQDAINDQRCTVVLHSFDWKKTSKIGLYFFLKKRKKAEKSGKAEGERKNLKKRNFSAKSGRGGNPG